MAALASEINRTEVDSARRYSKQALAMAQRIGYLRGEVMALNSLASTLYYADDYVKAQVYFTRLLAAATRAGMRRLVGHAYLGLGNVACTLGDITRGVGYYQQARAAYASCKPTHLLGEAMALNNIAGYLISAGRDREAAGPLRQGLALARQLGNTQMQVWCGMNLGRLQREEGHPDSATATWHTAQALAHRIGNLEAEGDILLNETELVLERGDAAQALRMAQQAARIGRQLGSPQTLVWAWGYMADAMRQLGRPEAFDTLKKRQELQDTLSGQEQRKTIAEQQVKFDVAQQHTRIKVLEQQRRISRLRADRQETRARFYAVTVASLLAIVVMGGLLMGLLVRSRRRLQTSEAELRASETELRAANQTKDQLMRIVGHDLRGPVASFQQLTPLLHQVVEQPDRTAAHELIRTLDAGAQQLGGFVDNLLQWTRARGGQVVNRPARLRADVVVASVRALYEPAAHLKQIKLESTAPPDLLVWADMDLLGTVLRNLVANALKFTPVGGTVTLRAESKGTNEVTFTVSDTGVGMDTTHLAELFAAERVESTPGTQGEPGTGLGLPLSARFTRLMGGELQGASAPGQGTRFWLSLPVPVGVAVSSV